MNTRDNPDLPQINLRDLFAAFAMAGSLSGETVDSGFFENPEARATFAYKQADAMLARRKINYGEPE